MSETWSDRPFRCPTCDSAFPELVVAGGCDDHWHEPEPRTVPQWRSEVERWAGILEQFSYAKNPVDAASRLAADMRRELAAQPPAPADDAATISIEKRMERPGAPDWGGEEALDGGDPIYHHAWDSDDGELRLWVGPYEGHRDQGWAVMVSGAGVDLVLRSDPDQILEWTVMVRQAVEESRPRVALPAAPDAAEVLAGLLAGFEHERWWSADDEVKFEIWTKAMRRVEAAQQRLADRGQSGMPDEFEPYLAEAMKRPGSRAAYEAALRDEENTDE